MQKTAQELAHEVIIKVAFDGRMRRALSATIAKSPVGNVTRAVSSRTQGAEKLITDKLQNTQAHAKDRLSDITQAARDALGL